MDIRVLYPTYEPCGAHKQCPANISFYAEINYCLATIGTVKAVISNQVYQIKYAQAAE